MNTNTTVTIEDVTVQETPITTLPAPEESTALSTTTSSAVSVQKVVFNEIDDEEFEGICKDKTYDTLMSICEHGVSTISGYPIYLLEDGVSGFYARKIQLRGGKSKIALNRYEVGKAISEDILISSKDIITLLVRGSNTDNRTIAKEIHNAERKIVCQLVEYCFGTVIISPIDVIDGLVNNFMKIPNEQEHDIDVNKIYCAIVEYAKADPPKLIERRGYYAFDSENIAGLSKQLGLRPKELIELIYKQGWLYIQKSAVGYQSKVKQWGNCYCIKTLPCFQTEEDRKAFDAFDKNLENRL